MGTNKLICGSKELHVLIDADTELTKFANSLAKELSTEEIKGTMRPRVQALFSYIETMEALQRYCVKDYDQLVDIVSKWHRYFSLMGESISLPSLPNLESFCPEILAKQIPRDTLVGTVVKESGQKTIKVLVQAKRQHEKYKKYVNKNKYLLVHDEQQRARIGDKVIIVSCRPISKTKRYRLFKIIHSSSSRD